MSFFKDSPYRSKKYREWIRELPCSVCGGESETHHGIALGYGEGGVGTKACDLLCMPLCHEHHSEMHSGGVIQEEQWRFICKTLQLAIKSGVIKDLDI